VSAVPDVETLHAALAAALARETGAPVEIDGLGRMAGGASKEAWRLDLSVAAGPAAGAHPLVLLRPMGGKIHAEALDLTREFQVLAAAYAAGVPVPRPYWCLPDLLGRPGALVARLAGESIGRRVVKEPDLAAARRLLPAQMGTALAAVHAIDLAAAGLQLVLPRPAPGETPARTWVGQMEADLDHIGEPHPALELALRWLRRHEPSPPARPVLVHGDYRIGNVLVTPEGLNGVLDWEFAHVGDPMEDLTWGLLRDWRFGVDHLHFGGIAAPEPFFAAYAAGGGQAPDPAAVRYGEVLGNVRWAVGTLRQAQRHLQGEEPNLELASLGRRCAEMELEALRLIETA
jgi:aminoglycoside phosphotransferase (APT) family kinase protein